MSVPGLRRKRPGAMLNRPGSQLRTSPHTSNLGLPCRVSKKNNGSRCCVAINLRRVKPPSRHSARSIYAGSSITHWEQRRWRLDHVIGNARSNYPHYIFTQYTLGTQRPAFLGNKTQQAYFFTALCPNCNQQMTEPIAVAAASVCSMDPDFRKPPKLLSRRQHRRLLTRRRTISPMRTPPSPSLLASSLRRART